MIVKTACYLLITTLTIAAVHCSTCTNNLVATAKAPVNQASATLKTRRCGSVDGWVVTLMPRDMSEQEIFQGVMPHPVSVAEAPHAIAIRWENDETLVISGPNWVRSHRREIEYGGVHIRYELTDVPYPAERANNR
ncbi:MAG TPA: hypothetical protein VJ276_19945 [Thermoanaerobaculia bacterium]|nr:hypothetical protein [Thermoanaerobaculia bacterium]